MLMIEKSLQDYISEAKSGEPTPGGGSVAALSGSLGAALTMMVGNLTIDRKIYKELDEEDRELMDKNFKLLDEHIEKLNAIVDEDTKAFDGVMDAFGMPKETDEEKAARSKAIEEGYKVALEVPLRCAGECLKAMKLQKIFADYGNIGALTDVGVGTLLLYTGLESALMNVLINLKGIKDEAFNEETTVKMDSMLEEGKKLKDELLDIVYGRLR